MILFHRNEDGEPEKIDGLPPEDWNPTSDRPLIPESWKDGIDLGEVLDSVEEDIEAGKLEDGPIHLDLVVTSGQRDDLRQEFYKRRDEEKYIVRTSKVQDDGKAHLGIEDEEKDLFEVWVNLRSRSSWDNPFEKEEKSVVVDDETMKELDELFDED